MLLQPPISMDVQPPRLRVGAEGCEGALVTEFFNEIPTLAERRRPLRCPLQAKALWGDPWGSVS